VIRLSRLARFTSYRWTSLWALGLYLVASCGTDAEGVEDCRRIEQARCDAGSVCGFITDADACRRFYRDQCLHGLAVQSPGGPTVSQCVSDINAAKACAGDAEACAEGESPETACEAVERPENLPNCTFLAPEPSGQGGKSGTGGTTSTAGAGGSSGAPAE